MYAKFDIGDRTMTVVSIPPGINPEIADSPLSDISGMHVYVSSHPDAVAYAKAIRNASDGEIELARPQLYFVLSEVDERLLHGSYRVETEFLKLKTPKDIIGNVLEGVSVDSKRFLSECDRNPRSRAAAQRLAGVMAYFAEVEAFVAGLADGIDESYRPLSEKASKAIRELASEIDELKRTTKERYPALSKALPSLDELRRAARAKLEETDFSVPRLSRERLERLMGECGDRDILWRISDGGKAREKYISKGWHRPLSASDAESLRDGSATVLEEYDSVYNSHGFVSELKQMAASLRYRGLYQAHQADTHTEAAIRRERKSIYDTKAEHERRLAERIAAIPRDKEFFRHGAAELLGAANMVSGFLAEAGRAFRSAQDVSGYLEFSVRDGAMVGESGGEEAIVIYDDHVVRAGGNHPDAVYAVKLPASALRDGVPPLEEIREERFSAATNYHSVEQCLGELDNLTESGFFFGGVRISGHNGFDVVGEWKSALAAGQSPSMK